MGVYSGNRTCLGSYDESEIVANENYFGEAGAMQIIAESVINDFAMFEAVISNDFQEVALGESYAEIELLQEASISGMFDKIKELAKKAWEKIKGLFKTFITKITVLMTRDNKSLVKKYQKEIYRKDLSKLKFKWEKPTGKSIGSRLNADSLITIIETAKNSGSIEDLEKKVNDSDFIDKVLSDLTELKNPSQSDFYKDVHEYMYEDEDEVEGMTSAVLSQIIETLTNSSKTLKAVKKTESNVNTFFNKLLSNIDKVRNEIAKDMPTKEKDNYAGFGTVTTKFGDEEKDFDIAKTTRYATHKGGSVSTVGEMNKRANIIYDLVNKYQQGATLVCNAEMKETKFGIAQARRLFGKAAAFNPKSVKESYIIEEAFADALDYEFDSFMESYEF